MAIPDVSVTILDGTLGVTPAPSDNIALVVGVASQGTTNAIQVFNGASGISSLATTFGTGPLVDAAAEILAVAGGPVYAVRIAAAGTGTNGSLTHTVGTQTATPTLSGNPLDQYDLVFKVVTAAANLAANAAAIQYSLDGGDNYSATVAIPTSGIYAIPGTGITITYADGTFVVGDTWTGSTTAPYYTTTELTTCLTAVLADPREWGFVWAVGRPASVSATASVAATLDTIMSTAASNYRFAHAIMDCADDTDANIISGLAASSSKRVNVCAGFEELVSPVSGLVRKRSSSYVVAARTALVPIHEDLGRVKTGPVVGVKSLYRDEQATPGLDAARLTTLRTIIGQADYFITSGRLIASTGSDFTYVPNRRVMDRACKTARDALLPYLNDTVRVQGTTDTTPGAIVEKDARAIEAAVNAALTDEVVSPGHASNAYVTVDRNANILSTSNMPVTVSVVPLGYARAISLTIGFLNPKLVPA